MTELDPFLVALRQRPNPRRLDQLETAVWSSIEDARTGAQMLWGWRAVAAAGALAIGVLAGGLATDNSPNDDFTPFSLHAAYAPSTLLSDDL